MGLDTVQGIIWDLDNTLYRFDDAFITACNVSAAKAALQCGVRMEFEDALALATRSQKEMGYSLHGFIVEHGIPYEDLHFPFHEGVDISIIRAMDGLSDALRLIDRPQVVLTNASRPWARRVLDHLGLSAIFPDPAIIPLEDSDFIPKARGPAPFEKALDALGLAAQSVVIVEDMPRNLVIPQQMGFLTALVHHGACPQLVEDFIHFLFPGPINAAIFFHNRWQERTIT